MEGMPDMRSLALLLGLASVVLFSAAGAVLLGDSGTAWADDDHGDYRTQATPLVVGAGLVTGEITPTTILFDVDYFSFTALRGTRYTIVLNLVTVDNANILVVNSMDRGAGSSPGQVFATGVSEKSVEWIARTTDTYFVEVSGTRDDVTREAILGGYTLDVTADTSLEDRHSETLGGATPIQPDNVYQGAISPWTNQPGLAGGNQGGDDHDYFSFLASRGVRYTVSAELGTTEGVEISLVKPTGGTEVTNGGVGTSLEWISSTSTLYYIDVSGSSRFRDSIGTYLLKLTADTAYEDRHSDVHIGATPVNFGNAHQGAVSPVDDQDTFSFEAIRGVRYSIGGELGTAQGIGLAIEGSDGELVASNGGIGTQVDWLAQATNTYYVVVSGSLQVRDPVGTYSLIVDADTTLRDRHGDSRSQATAINFGNEHRSAISPANDRDFFSFQAKRGVAYSIGVVLGTAGGVEIEVAKPGVGTEVSNGGVGTSIEWTAPVGDIYYLAISAPAQVVDPIGTYTLQVEAITALEDRHGETRENATPATIGSTYQAAISPRGDHDYFSFRASRGVKYAFELMYGTASAVSLTVDKVGGGPTSGARNYGEGTDVIWTAPDSDNYFIEVSGSPRIEDPTGTYRLKITADASLEDRHGGVPAEATRIIVGNAMAGAISPPDDLDYFYIDAEQGDKYTVRVDLGTAEAVEFSVSHALLGFTASNYGSGTSLAWQAPITGRYVVAISKSNESSEPTGTYQVIILSGDVVPIPTPTPTPVPPVPTPTPAGPTPIPPGPALVVESRTGSTDGTVLVPVVLERAQEVSSLGFTLGYDPAVLEVVSVQRGSRLSPGTFSYDADAPGIIRLGFSSTTGLSTDGSAVAVEFRIVGEDGSTSQLTLSEDLASDFASRRLTLDLVDGEVTIGQRIGGDGNGDGKITVLDALIALKIFGEQSPLDLVMDVNGDGRVTPEDARQILAMARPG
jgi:hypothetical protein